MRTWNSYLNSIRHPRWLFDVTVRSDRQTDEKRNVKVSVETQGMSVEPGRGRGRGRESVTTIHNRQSPDFVALLPWNVNEAS